VGYSDGLFAALSYDGFGQQVMTSPDGINWTIRESPEAGVWQALIYGNGTFVAVADTGQVMTSESTTIPFGNGGGGGDGGNSGFFGRGGTGGIGGTAYPGGTNGTNGINGR
jgi:hypothetical protein